MLTLESVQHPEVLDPDTLTGTLANGTVRVTVQRYFCGWTGNLRVHLRFVAAHPAKASRLAWHDDEASPAERREFDELKERAARQRDRRRKADLVALTNVATAHISVS